MKFTMKNEATGEIRDVRTGPIWYLFFLGFAVTIVMGSIRLILNMSTSIYQDPSQLVMLIGIIIGAILLVSKIGLVIISLLRKQGKLVLLNLLIVGLIGGGIIFLGFIGADIYSKTIEETDFALFFVLIVTGWVKLGVEIVILIWLALLSLAGNNYSYNKYIKKGYKITDEYVDNSEVQKFVKRSEGRPRLFAFFV